MQFDYLQAVYTADHEPLNYTIPGVRIFPYGHYRFTFWFGVENNENGCWRADAHLVPKVK